MIISMKYRCELLKRYNKMSRERKRERKLPNKTLDRNPN